MLYCTVLYHTILVLYCTVLYCTVPYRTVLYCTVLYCTVLYCTVLYCAVLYCTVLRARIGHDRGQVPERGAGDAQPRGRRQRVLVDLARKTTLLLCCISVINSFTIISITVV